MALPLVHAPSEKTFCGGHAADALEPIDCPVPKIGDIINAQAFTEFANDQSGDIYHDYLRMNRLFNVGTVPSKGLGRVFERHVFVRCVYPEEAAVGELGSSWYEIPDTDLPYINFHGVNGTHLWLQVHDLRLVKMDPIYENESLRDTWLNIYSKMRDGTAETILTNTADAQVRRDMAERDCNKDDEEPA
ncbi:hypothetical protein KC356_g8905 [Hortaea werneckii]|nr:hypothetical protein KC356_g8905 [Hortaea werneckii]